MPRPETKVEARTEVHVDDLASPTPVALSAVVVLSVFCVVVWGLWVLFGGGPGRAPRPEPED
jgi:hypothetical protein